MCAIVDSNIHRLVTKINTKFDNWYEFCAYKTSGWEHLTPRSQGSVSEDIEAVIPHLETTDISGAVDKG